MKKKLVQSLSNLDQFGSISQLTFFNDDAKFKTLQGGIVSIIIVSLGFAYFVYLMFMWKTNQMPPIVTNQSVYIQELRTLELKTQLFVLQFVNGQINDELFSLQEKGLLWEVASTSENEMYYEKNPQGYDCSQNKTEYDYFDPVCLNLRDEQQRNLAQDFQNKSQDDGIQFMVLTCDPRYNPQCLSLEEQGKLLQPSFNNTPSWRLTLFTQDIDLLSGEIINVPQDFQIRSYDYSSNYNLPSGNIFIKVRKAIYIIDDGIFFPNEKYYEVVTSVEYQLLESNMILEYTQLSNGLTEIQKQIFKINVSLDRSEEVRRVVYPKIGQVLAEFGSIIQVLLLLGTLMNKFNTFWMDIKVEEALLKIYFPKSKIYSFNYDLIGKIKSIYCDGKHLKDGDFQQVKQFRQAQGKQMKTKLNFMNILHELSRLQIHLQLELPRERIIQLQDLGYRAKLPEKYHLDSKEGKLDYEDYLLIQKKKEEEILTGERVLTFGDKLRFIDSVQVTSPQNFALYDIPI